MNRQKLLEIVLKNGEREEKKRDENKYSELVFPSQGAYTSSTTYAEMDIIDLKGEIKVKQGIYSEFVFPSSFQDSYTVTTPDK